MNADNIYKFVKTYHGEKTQTTNKWIQFVVVFNF